MRERFTLVLKGHIAIARAVFPDGIAGAQLDPFARQALWAHGLDFDHGTGHGVGSYLSVHEGPARISKLGNIAAQARHDPVERARLLQSRRIRHPDREPGAGGGGRRRSRAREKPLNAFETLTLAPIDRRLIERKLLDAGEMAWLDAYHARVAATLGAAGRRRDAGLARRRDAAARAGLRRCAWTTSPPSNCTTIRAQPTRETPWGLLLLLMAMTSIGPTTLNIVVPALPQMANRLASDVATIQLTVSVYLLALAAGQLVMGPLSDRFGRRPVLLAGLALTAAASVLAIVGRHGRQPDRGARAAGVRRLGRHRGEPRHHPRSVRPQPRRRR